MDKPFLLHFKPTDKWSAGKTSHEQAHWDQHHTFQEKLMDSRKILLGGPLADYSALILVVLAEDSTAASQLFRDDPWIVNGLLQLKTVQEWQLDINVWRR